LNYSPEQPPKVGMFGEMKYKIEGVGWMTEKPETMEVICPKCSTQGTVLWFRGYGFTYRKKGTTGGSGLAFSGKSEYVEGRCSSCNYKFKLDDL